MTILVLVATLDTSTKQATPRQNVNPFDQLMTEVRSLDPKGLMFQEVRYVGTMNVAEIVVTDAWNRATYENRRSFINWLRLTWERLNPPSMGMVVLVN